MSTRTTPLIDHASPTHTAGTRRAGGASAAVRGVERPVRVPARVVMPSEHHRVLDKLRRYRGEPERFALTSVAPLTVRVAGLNAEHRVRRRRARLVCDCERFARIGRCAHALATAYHLPRLLAAALG